MRGSGYNPLCLATAKTVASSSTNATVTGFLGPTVTPWDRILYFVDKKAQAAMHAGLDANPLVTLHDYASCDHGFARPDGVHEDKEAAQETNTRPFNFFANTLG